jgi:Flp pilus assembly pilin Flp
MGMKNAQQVCTVTAMREPTRNSEKGQTTSEYALMLVAIAMFLWGVYANFTSSIDMPILKAAAALLRP